MSSAALRALPIHELPEVPSTLMGSGDWLSSIPIWQLALLLFAVTAAAALAAHGASRLIARLPATWGSLTETQEGYVITIVYTLLGLLVGFTFSIAVDRFQGRRELVIRQAAAIEQLYLRAQLLDEPDRSRFSSILVEYSENLIALGQTRHDDEGARKLAAKHEMLDRQLWIATVPAFQRIRSIDFSSTFVDSVNEVLKVDAERQAARESLIPRAIIIVLVLYSIIAAALLGTVMRSRIGAAVTLVMLALSTVALSLITDMNRPVEGTVLESQRPIERMLTRLKSTPPAAYQQLADVSERH